MQCLSFDIITAPDLASGCHLYGLQGLESHAITNAMLYKQRQLNGDEQLPLQLQCVVAASVVEVENGRLTTHLLQDEDEARLIRQLFDLLNGESCRICWHHSQSLVLLQLRALKWGIALPLDWPLDDWPRRRLLQCGWFDLQLLLKSTVNGNTLKELAALISLPSQLGCATQICREIESAEQLQQLQYDALANAIHLYLIYLRLAWIQGVLLESEYQLLQQALADQLQNSEIAILCSYGDSWLNG